MTTRVFERLYLGDARDAERLSLANPFGISAVVNVNGGGNHSKCAGVEYVHLAFDESESVPPAKFELRPIVATKLSARLRDSFVEGKCSCTANAAPLALRSLSLCTCTQLDTGTSMTRCRNSSWLIESATCYLTEAI